MTWILMLLLEPDNILKMIDKLKKWGYRPRAPVDPQGLADEATRKSWIRNIGPGPRPGGWNGCWPATV